MTRTENARDAFFFDLDGTLTDPKPGITGCIQYALGRMSKPVPSKEALEWCIGPPLLDNFTKLVGAELAADGVVYYRERFGEVGLFENEVYSGIPEALAELRANGARLFVASSKPLVYVRRILDHFDLSPFFDGVFGSELDGTRNDKVELLDYALRKTEVAAGQATMIGDRGLDARGAIENQMEFLGVLYGYGSLEELEAAGATEWIDRPSDLVGRLRSVPPK